MWGVGRSRDGSDNTKQTIQHGGKACPNYGISGEQRKECTNDRRGDEPKTVQLLAEPKTLNSMGISQD